MGRVAAPSAFCTCQSGLAFLFAAHTSRSASGFDDWAPPLSESETLVLVDALTETVVPVDELEDVDDEEFCLWSAFRGR